MVWLYVLIAVAAVIGLILAVNFHIEFKYSDSLKIYLRISAIRIDVLKTGKKVLGLINRNKKKKKNKSVVQNTSENPQEEPKASDVEKESSDTKALNSKKADRTVKADNSTDSKAETSDGGSEDSSQQSDDDIVSQVKKSENIIRKALSRTGPGGLTDVIIDLIAFVSTLGGSVKKHLVVKCEFSYSAVGTDSANTAKKYGYICAAAYTIYGFLCNLVNVKSFRTAIKPDFLGKKSSGEIYLDISYRLLWVVSLAFRAVIGYVKVNMSQSKSLQVQKNGK